VHKIKKGVKFCLFTYRQATPLQIIIYVRLKPD